MNYLVSGRDKEYETKREGETKTLKEGDSFDYDTKRPRMDFITKYKVYEDGELKKEVDEKRELAILTTETFKLLSKICGFKLVKFYGNFEGKPLENFKRGEEVSRLIYVGR